MSCLTTNNTTKASQRFLTHQKTTVSLPLLVIIYVQLIALSQAADNGVNISRNVSAVNSTTTTTSPTTTTTTSTTYAGGVGSVTTMTTAGGGGREKTTTSVQSSSTEPTNFVSESSSPVITSSSAPVSDKNSNLSPMTGDHSRTNGIETGASGIGTRTDTSTPIESNLDDDNSSEDEESSSSLSSSTTEASSSITIDGDDDDENDENDDETGYFKMGKFCDGFSLKDYDCSLICSCLDENTVVGRGFQVSVTYR